MKHSPGCGHITCSGTLAKAGTSFNLAVSTCETCPFPLCAPPLRFRPRIFFLAVLLASTSALFVRAASRSSKFITFPFPLHSTIDLVARRALLSLLIRTKNCIRSCWSTFLTMDICAALVSFARRRSRLRFFASSSACASCVMIRSCSEVKASADTGVTGVAGVVGTGTFES